MERPRAVRRALQDRLGPSCIGPGIRRRPRATVERAVRPAGRLATHRPHRAGRRRRVAHRDRRSPDAAARPDRGDVPRGHDTVPDPRHRNRRHDRADHRRWRPRPHSEPLGPLALRHDLRRRHARLPRRRAEVRPRADARGDRRGTHSALVAARRGRRVGKAHREGPSRRRDDARRRRPHGDHRRCRHRRGRAPGHPDQVAPPGDACAGEGRAIRHQVSPGIGRRPRFRDGGRGRP